MKTKISLIAAMMALVIGVSSANAATLSINADTGINVNTASSSVNANTQADTNAGMSSSSGSMNSMNDDMNGQSSTGVNLMVVGAQVRSMASVSQSITSPAQVQSDDTLSSYAQVVASKDTSISAISSTGDNVAVTYDRPARLFGFIPVTMSETANVSVSGGSAAVSVNKPWWSFLASSHTQSDKFASAIQAEINNGSITASGSLSDSVKAQILADIEASNSATY